LEQEQQQWNKCSHNTHSASAPDPRRDTVPQQPRPPVYKASSAEYISIIIIVIIPE